LASQDLPEWDNSPDLPILLDRLRNGRPIERKRAIAVLSSRHGIAGGVACRFLEISRGGYRHSLKVFAEGGSKALFARRINPHRKYDDEVVKRALFSTLHQPPAAFGINRTTWTIVDLSRAMKRLGTSVGEDVIRTIIRAAGYRWRKARVVLTSNDPEFSQKVAHIRSILGRLSSDEAFFSIDEYGPLAIKHHSGRSLVGPCEQPLVAQWQRSRGSLIVTAAIELSTNQVTHFYSEKKNTSEMIKMMDRLISQYHDRLRIYLSWDAASWHISSKLSEHIRKHNSDVDSQGPQVETAPLPARAQFLNVIESIFSGMARAVVHNSNYRSVAEAKAAIARYFEERNAHFAQHPKRAGKKIWGKEPEPATFSEGANCKAPWIR
jgi:hypothetical protein